MDTQIEKLQQQATQLHGDITALEAAVEAENRSMTPDELKTMAEKQTQFSQITDEIELRQKTIANQAKLTAPQPRKVEPLNYTPAPTTSATRPITGGGQVAHNFQNHGFASGFGEFLMSVRNARVFGKTDPRLMVNAVTSFGGETVGADGGFALPTAFSTGIMSLAAPTQSVTQFLNPVQTSSNLLVVPTDEDTPWATTAVTGALTREGAAITASKPLIKKLNVVIHGVKSLVHVSEESLSDIPFLASYVQQKMGEKLRWKIENYILNGTGQDEPMGILNAPGLLALTDADSTATVFGAVDIMAMKAAALPGAGGFWLVSPTVLPQIWSLKTGTAGYPLFTPDMTKSESGTLLGSPIVVSEACPAINTTGDILFVVPNGYVLAFNGGVNTQATIGFAFDQDLQSFKATVRMGGVPTLSTKVTRANGSTYASNLVAITGSRS